MNISIGNDHAGVDYKNYIIENLNDRHDIKNHGTDLESSVDYPDFAHPVSSDVDNKKSDLGILICGSGNGVAMTANKYKKVRAALCWNEELAVLAKQHNNANILSFGSRFIQPNRAIELIKVWLNTNFEGGRHQKRIEKLDS